MSGLVGISTKSTIVGMCDALSASRTVIAF
jgi:hypothetical protein